MWAKSETRYVFDCNPSSGSSIFREDIYECYKNNSMLSTKLIDQFLLSVSHDSQGSLLVVIQFMRPAEAYAFGKHFVELFPRFKENFKEYPNTNYYKWCTSNDELDYSTVEIDISQQHLEDLKKLCDFLRQQGLSADILEKIKMHARCLSEIEKSFYEQLTFMQQQDTDKKELFNVSLGMANSISKIEYKIRALLELAAVCRNNMPELEQELQVVLATIKAAGDYYGYSSRAAAELRQFALNTTRLKRTRDAFESVAVTESANVDNIDEKIKEDLRLDMQLALCQDNPVETLNKIRSTIIRTLRLGPSRASKFFSDISLSTIIVEENEDKIENLFVKLIIELLIYTKYLHQQKHIIEQKIGNISLDNIMCLDYNQQELEKDLKLEMLNIREEKVSFVEFLTNIRNIAIKFLSLDEEQINKFFNNFMPVYNASINRDEEHDEMSKLLSDFIVNILMYSKHLDMQKSYLEQTLANDYASIAESSSNAKKQRI